MAKKDLLVARIPSSAKEIRKWWSKLDDGEAGDNLRAAVQFYLDYSDYADVLKLSKLIGVSPEEAMRRIQTSSISSVAPVHTIVTPAIKELINHHPIRNIQTKKADQGTAESRVNALLDDD